ncbi:MAG: hypothetical protein FJX76_26205, partial [Armatimonadetes bacterium]|nr:hypothetical protein [Armatimonadota bacterium]
MRTLLLLLLLLTAAAHAWEPDQRDAATVTFHTFPSGATVSIIGLRKNTLGLSGTPVTVNVPTREDATLRARFELEGYRPFDVDVRAEDLRRGRLPLEGSYSLTPDGLFGPAGLFVKRYPYVPLALIALIAWTIPRQRRMLKLRSVAKDPDDPNVGKVLHNWLFTRRLGSGGNATVYEAIPASTLDFSKATAVKVMRADAVDEEFLRRFAREFHICKSLHHPGIVRVLDWQDGDPMCIEMELVRGRTLRSFIVPGGMPLDETVKLLRPIAEAVDYAHMKKIVHNDLKPGNILVTDDLTIRVLDFGVATGAQHTRLTATGDALGTPGYMAPEQFDGIRNEPRSDQYAFGVIVFEMLTGERPFDTSDAMRCMADTLNTPPPRIVNIPDPVADAVD